MLWHQVRVHLDIRELVGMSLEVNFEIAFGGEPIAADIALVGSFACMRANVDL